MWFTAYPLSLVTAPGQSFLGALGDEELWAAFAKIGIEAVHTGPLKLAGGISGWLPTPSVDGHFDRISMQIDPAFGTEEEFREMCANAARRHGTIIDDIVPGHTGKGADFRLAELNYLDYPGIYHMVDIPEDAWHLLPEVPEGQDAVNLTPEAERGLAEAGYIIGELQRVIFYEPGVKETNWSVTPPIYDYKGKLRRWVYLHYFKEGQPSINWLDPSFAGMRLVMGDALHSLLDLGSGGLRLDANGFLGVEKSLNQGPGWSEGHPLSQAANQLIGSMVRKVGGFTFQELNLAIDDIVDTGAVGPDLSYDFVTRPAYQFALCHRRHRVPAAHAAGGAAPRRRPGLAGARPAEPRRAHLRAGALRPAPRGHLHPRRRGVHRGRARRAGAGDHASPMLTGEAAPYNALFVQNGIACTTASVIAASLGITDLDSITDADVRRISNAHLLLCMYNAWQPGVFALSGWDLVGALPLDRGKVKGLIGTGDTRWIERGAYDLIGHAHRTPSGRRRACRWPPPCTATCPTSWPTPTRSPRGSPPS